MKRRPRQKIEQVKPDPRWRDLVCLNQPERAAQADGAVKRWKNLAVRTHIPPHQLGAFERHLWLREWDRAA